MKLLGGALGLYLFYAALMTVYVPSAIYPFDDRPFSADTFEEAQVGDLPVRVADAGPGAPVVLYFMGNAGSLAYFTDILTHHRAQGRSVVAMTYRGGGGVPGHPTEAGLKADALAVFDAVPDLLRDPGAVALHGYSLGTGLALHVAARRDADAVVLTAPYARLCELMAQQSLLPACRMPKIRTRPLIRKNPSHP